MLKQIPLILASLLIFTGCNKSPYKTIGKVEMDKLVHIDTLWKYREDYLGKTVTIKMDTLGTHSETRGEFYNGMYETFHGYRFSFSSAPGSVTYFKEIKEFFEHSKININDSTLITDFRVYEVSILQEPKPSTQSSSRNKLLTESHENIDVILQDSIDNVLLTELEDIGESAEKWISGVFSNSKQYTSNHKVLILKTVHS